MILEMNRWLRIWNFNHPLRSRFRGFLAKLRIKFKYRRVIITLNYDEYAWLKADLKDLNGRRGEIRSINLYHKMMEMHQKSMGRKYEKEDQ